MGIPLSEELTIVKGHERPVDIEFYLILVTMLDWLGRGRFVCTSR